MNRYYDDEDDVPLGVECAWPSAGARDVTAPLRPEIRGSALAPHVTRAARAPNTRMPETAAVAADPGRAVRLLAALVGAAGKKIVRIGEEIRGRMRLGSITTSGTPRCTFFANFSPARPAPLRWAPPLRTTMRC